jgi:nucleoid-associated protein YgaU
MGLEQLIIQNSEKPDKKLTCLFNPTEYSIAKTNNWKTKDNVGKNVPQVDFTGGGARTLSMTLFFDVLEQPGADVRKYVDQLWELTMIDETKKHTKTKRARPPFCHLTWGQHWTFKAAMLSLTVKYTLFREDGTPVRATAEVKFQEVEDQAQQKKTNPTSYAEPGRRCRVLKPRDTLALIAYEEYGDPNYWRVLADYNHLDDPLDLRAGEILAVPPLS